MVCRVYSARVFFFLIVVAVSTAGSSRAQPAGQSVTIIVAERHAFSLSLAPKSATEGTVIVPRAAANQRTKIAPSYKFESSREAKKITAILSSVHGQARALLSMAPPERGFGTGLQSLGSEAQDLVVGYFPPGQQPLGLEYRALAGTDRSVLTLTITD